MGGIGVLVRRPAQGFRHRRTYNLASSARSNRQTQQEADAWAEGEIRQEVGENAPCAFERLRKRIRFQLARNNAAASSNSASIGLDADVHSQSVQSTANAHRLTEKSMHATGL